MVFTPAVRTNHGHRLVLWHLLMRPDMDTRKERVPNEAIKSHFHQKVENLGGIKSSVWCFWEKRTVWHLGQCSGDYWTVENNDNEVRFGLKKHSVSRYFSSTFLAGFLKAMILSLYIFVSPFLPGKPILIFLRLSSLVKLPQVPRRREGPRSPATCL